MSQPFYIVINARLGPSSHPHKHETFHEAQHEAERIASISPGDKVFVLRAVGFAVKKRADWVDFEQPDLDDEIPF